MVRIAHIGFGVGSETRSVASIRIGERNEVFRERRVRFGSIRGGELLNFKPVQHPGTDLCRHRNGNGGSGNDDNGYSKQDVHRRHLQTILAATPLPWASWEFVGGLLVIPTAG